MAESASTAAARSPDGKASHAWLAHDLRPSYARAWKGLDASQRAAGTRDGATESKGRRMCVFRQSLGLHRAARAPSTPGTWLTARWFGRQFTHLSGPQFARLFGRRSAPNGTRELSSLALGATGLGILLVALTAAAVTRYGGATFVGTNVPGPLTVTATLFAAPNGLTTTPSAAPSHDPNYWPTAPGSPQATPTSAPTSAPPPSAAVLAPPTSTSRTTTQPPTTSPAMSPPAARAACRYSYAFSSVWSSGFVVNITLKNQSSTPWHAWQGTLSISPSVGIVGSWGATVTVTGTQGTLVPASYNTDVAPGASITLGFQAATSGAPTVLSGFTVQGQSCQA